MLDKARLMRKRRNDAAVSTGVVILSAEIHCATSSRVSRSRGASPNLVCARPTATKPTES